MNALPKHLKKSTLATVIALSLQTGVIAQEKDTKSAESGIEVIQITSQKRTQSIQEVGIAVTALDGAALKEQGIDTPSDIDKVMPNVAVRNVGGGGVPVVIIRGVGLQNFRINDSPTSSFYIDEVYQTSIASAEFSMYDLERLEVLKGPQGGLYGRNTIGGAIQVISARPTLDDESSGYVDLAVGSYQARELEFGVNLPVSENSAARVSGRAESNGDKDFYRVSDNKRYGDSERWGLRGQYLYQASDEVELLFKAHGGSQQTELPLLQAIGLYSNIGNGAAMGLPGVSLGLLSGLSGAGKAGLCQSILDGRGSDPTTCATLTGVTPEDYGLTASRYASAGSGRLPFLDNQWAGASLIADIDINGMTLTSITAYDNIDYQRVLDADATPVEFQDIDYETDISFWSQELRLTSAQSDTFNWILGASYSQDKLVESTSLSGGEGILPLAFGGATQSKQDYEQKTEGYALYGHGDYALTAAVNLITELRYTKEDKSFDGGATILFPGDIVAPFLDVDDSTSFDAFSGKIGATWAINDELMAFANLSRGFKTGGYFGGFATSLDQLAPYDEETIVAYEVGFKSDLLDNTLRINGSLFHYDRQDVQLNAANPTGLVQISRLTNIGDVETNGAELDVTWAATERLKVQLGLGYTDAEIVESDFTNKILLPLAGSAPIVGANLPNYSKFSSNLQLRHEHELGDSLFGIAQLEHSYRSERDLSMITEPALEDAVFKEPGYALVNLRYIVESEAGDWKAMAYINNISDKIYREEARPDGLNGVRQRYSLGRTWGINLTYSW